MSMECPEPAVPAEPWVRLSDLVERAATLVSSDGVEIIQPGDTPPTSGVAAVLYETGLRRLEPSPPEVPVAQVSINVGGRGLGALIPTDDGEDLLMLSAQDQDAAVAKIASWLRGHVDIGLTDYERQCLEAVVMAVTRWLQDATLDDYPAEEVAQAQAAVDTVAVQLRAPRPSRRILAWALGQIPGFVVGALSGAAGNYLTMLSQTLVA